MANWAQFGHFHLGVYSPVASGLDINGCVLSYFEGLANAQLYKLYTHYFTLYQSVISSVLSHEKISNIYKNVRGVLTSVRYCICFHSSHLFALFKKKNYIQV